MLTMTVMITVLPGWAQQVPSHTMHGLLETVPVLPGQDAFGAIQEVVRILEADPVTDWSKVDLERLRQHLVEMNEVTLHAAVKAETIPSGIRLVVVAKDPTDAKTIARIRGLDFIGLLVQGAHHQPHHLAMARGEAISGHSH